MTEGNFSPKPEYRFDNSVPNRLFEQTRLSILSWNPGLRRCREGAIEEHSAVNWHVIALQEAIEYLQHECFTNASRITSTLLTTLVALSCLTRLSLGHLCQVHVPP